MVTKQKPPEPGALERQQKRQVRTARNRRFGAFAIAAAIGVVALVLIVVIGPGKEPTIPADTSPPITTEADAANIAAGFVTAIGSLDAEQAITYLAEDADLTGMVTPATSEGLRSLVSWFSATGYKQTLDACTVVANVPETIFVSCSIDFYGLRSDEIGRGPFGGSAYSINVHEGRVTGARLDFNTFKFSPRVWEPFANWVSKTYPKDAAVMYTDGMRDYSLTDRSIRLWEQRNKEWVKGLRANQAQ
jgi:hypothetical protein